MTLGVVNYLQDGAESSLYRNGKVLIRRDVDGSDTGVTGVQASAKEIAIVNARERHGDAAMTCETNGFELLHAPLTNPTLDFYDHQQVVREYYADCERLLAEVTGARVYAFDHNIRSAAGKATKQRISSGQEVQGPAKMVHGDYTLVSAPQRARDLAQPPKINDTYAGLVENGASLVSESQVERALAGGRFAIINVWRNIAAEPVHRDALALCDGQTVDPEELVVFEIHYADRVGENYFAKHSGNHTFYYYPHMTRDEALLIKQWDSAGALAQSAGRLADTSHPGAPCTFSFHTAFDEVSAKNAKDAENRLDAPANLPDRQSIEVRCLVIYA